MVGDRDVDDTTALVSQDHQYEQEAARGGRHDEEVGGCDLLQMIGEERAPRLRRWCGTSRHVLRDCRLGHVDTKFQ
jgi:hypothetical protein